MTIQEAIRSGRPLHRKKWAEFDSNTWYVREGGRLVSEDGRTAINVDLHHALADDWELKPEPRKPKEWYCSCAGAYWFPGPSRLVREVLD